MRASSLSFWLVFIAVSAAGAGSAAVRPEPIHPERMDMSPSDRRDRVLADLETILAGPASPTAIATAPYLSSREGLCQREVVYLAYEREREDMPRSQFKPVGIRQVSTQYHRLGYANEASRDSWKEACRNLSNRQVYWAVSESDASAEFALSSLDIAVADVRKNEHVLLDCQDLDGGKESNCASTFLSAASQVSKASRCTDRTDGVRSQCSTFLMDRYDVTIIRTYASDGYSTVIEIRYAPIVVF